MLLDAAGGGGEVPAGNAHEQVDAGAGAAHVILAAALIAEPAAFVVVAVPAVAIGATAGGTWLVLIGELIRREATKGLQDLRPATGGLVESGWHVRRGPALGGGCQRRRWSG